MKERPSAELESCRVLVGPYKSSPLFLMTGAFVIPSPAFVSRNLGILSHDGNPWKLSGQPWQHVSVCVVEFPGKYPTHEEMLFVRSLFFEEEECLMEFYLPKSFHINRKDNTRVIHLWRPMNTEISLPPNISF